MEETYFFRNLEDIKSLEIKTEEKIKNKRAKNKYQIIDTIELEEKEFQKFCLNFKHNYKFLYKYIEEMKVDKDGIWKCVEIESNNKKILVQNNGYSYPRFTGLIL